MNSSLRNQTLFNFMKTKEQSTSTPNKQKQFSVHNDKPHRTPLLACNENTQKSHGSSSVSVSTPVKVYQDPVVPASYPVTTCSRDTQTEEFLLEALIQERQSSESLDSGRGSTLSLTDLSDLTSDTPSENYWKELAEERKAALNETLEENQALWEEVVELKEQNSRLGDIAKKAEALEELLREVMPNDETGNGDDNTDDKDKDLPSGENNDEKTQPQQSNSGVDRS